MANINEKITVIVEKTGKRTITKSPLSGKSKAVVIINNQFTNAPNTTQIASGAGRSSAAGSNVAIASSNTRQQQSVGAGGKAKNVGIKGKRYVTHKKHGKKNNAKEIVIVINNQVVKRSKRKSTSSATQVASGSGTYSTSGTNSAIESSNTKQQHAVGGGPGSRAINKLIKGKQKEIGLRRRKPIKRSWHSTRLKHRRNSL
ncbi:hypothetical protein [Polycladomyces subterraneus]|uniref:hypothetical protein n=1 Tax=Polycladomyces subterraneus TaxID=1016997 RepID=UPI003423DA86